jgi:hypothetical protein
MKIWSKFKKVADFMVVGSLLFFVLPMIFIVILLFGDDIDDEFYG